MKRIVICLSIIILSCKICIGWIGPVWDHVARRNINLSDYSLTHVYTIYTDSIAANNFDFISIMDNTTYYGSQWGRGHDSQGWDNVDAQSFTTDGAPIAGGNKNDELNINAGAFCMEGFGNSASILNRLFEATYSGVVSTVAIFYVKCPDSIKPNFTYVERNWSKQWDDGTVNVYIDFVTSGTSAGYVLTELGISTCPTGTWEIYTATTTVGSGWCDVRTATMTITSTNVIVDGKNIDIHLGKDSGDSTVQTVYYKNVKFAFTKD